MAIKAHLGGLERIKGQRGAPRRALRFETLGAPETGDARTVLVNNVSATGLLLESATELKVGEPIDIDLPQTGMTPAHVVWSSGALYGCRFERPVSSATLAAVELRSDAALEIGVPSVAPRLPHLFGPQLRRLRKLEGMTLAQLADRLDVSKPTVWAWENGKSRPLPSRMTAIAKALGVDECGLIETRRDPDAGELLARSREDIARALGIEPGKVRIMIEI